MPQIGQLILVSTNPATQFILAGAQNVGLTENLPPASDASGAGFIDGGISAGGTMRARLRSISIQSVQNLAWEVWLWRRDTFNASLTDPALNSPAGRWSFATGDGLRIGGAVGLFYYYIEGLDHYYVDLDRTGELHVMLVNRTGTAKLADAAGAVQITWAFEPTQG